MQKLPDQMQSPGGQVRAEPWVAQLAVQLFDVTFIMQFGSVLHSVAEDPYATTHGFAHVPCSVHAQAASVHSCFVPHSEH